MAVDNKIVQETIQSDPTGFNSFKHKVTGFLNQKLQTIIDNADGDYSPKQVEMAGLVKQSISTSTPDGIIDAIGIGFTAVAKRADSPSMGTSTKFVFKSVLGGITPLASVGIDLAMGDDLIEAVAKEVAGAIAGALVATAVVLGVEAATGAALTGAAALLVGSAALVIEYGVSNFTVAEVGERYRYYLGPNYEHVYPDFDKKTLELTILNGKLSDALRAYWHGGNTIIDKNILKEDIVHEDDLEEWAFIQRTDGEEPIEIRYDNHLKMFQFKGTGDTTFSEFYTNQGEHHEIARLIVEKQEQDFDVSIGTTTNPITNYYNRTIASLAYDAATNHDSGNLGHNTV